MPLPSTDRIREAMVRALADGTALDTRTGLEPRVAGILELSDADRRARSSNGTSVLLNTIDALTGSADRNYGYFERAGPRRYRLSEQGRRAAHGLQPLVEREYDELVLTLEQYLRTNVYVETSDSEILALNDLVSRLPGPQGDLGRSPETVIRMLHRWKQIDESTGVEDFMPPTIGTSREKAVWTRFIIEPHGDTTELDAAVTAIKALVEDGPVDLPPAEDEAEAPEGRLLFRQHRARERDPEITRRKKAAAMDSLGRLACEVCDFDFAASYGSLGEGFIECHHRLPLATAGARITKLDDLALVCSNCHRMLHRARPALTVEALRTIISNHTNRLSRVGGST